LPSAISHPPSAIRYPPPAIPMPAFSLRDAALTHFQRKEYADALKLFEQAHEAYLAEDDREMAAEMQNDLGVVYRAQKNYPLALQMIKIALIEFREINDVIHTAQTLGNLGSLYLEIGELSHAADSLNESLALFDPQKDKVMRSEVLRVLGEVRLKQGKYMEGLMNYEAGLRDVENPTPQQRWLRKLLATPLKMMGMK
jgi:tetratricopeptide (TPR) repeat protein